MRRSDIGERKVKRIVAKKLNRGKGIRTTKTQGERRI